jgi:hypothetical protein
MKKRILKYALIALAGVGCWAAVQQARQAADLPAVRHTVVTTQPGVAPDVIQVTYFSSDVRCATCVRIERLTRETVEKNFAAEIASGGVVLQTINLDGAATSTSCRTTSSSAKRSSFRTGRRVRK